MEQKRKQEYWAGQIAGWKASGLTQKAYCQEHGLVYPTFSYWQRKALVQDGLSVTPAGLAVVEVCPAINQNPLGGARDCVIAVSGLAIQWGTACISLSGQLSLGKLAQLAALCQEDGNHVQA